MRTWGWRSIRSPRTRYALAGGNPVSYIETDGHLAILDDIADALKQAFNKVSDGIRDAAANTSDALNKASDEASKSTRDWLNSDIGKQVQPFAKTAQENMDGLYGLVEKGKNLNTIDGSRMGNKKLPQPFRQVGSWWMRNVTQDKGFKALLKTVDSPIGNGSSAASVPCPSRSMRPRTTHTATRRCPRSVRPESPRARPS